ncbi:MAG: hemerythrin domain-containing protein [Anaerolineae bacterium]|nr:hemerythrin domain-containing protein [Anaerolineae bacterium]
MTIVTQPLRDEHQELLPHIEHICTVADHVGDIPAESLRRGVDEVYDFLAHHLLVHAEAEERALYPVIAEMLGAPDATATMRRDHVEIGQLIGELAGLRAQIGEGALPVSLAKGLRRVLYGLYALVKVHFAKEEEVYLPLLDAQMSAEEARQLFEKMEAAAQEARTRH